MRELTDREATELFESRRLLSIPPRFAIAFQLTQDRLCMPWPHLRAALETVLERAVDDAELRRWNRRALLAELEPRLGDPLELVVETVAAAVGLDGAT